MTIITAQNGKYPAEYTGKKGCIVGCANVHTYRDCKNCEKDGNGCSFSSLKLVIDGLRYTRPGKKSTDSGIAIVTNDRFLLDESDERVQRMISI